MKPARMLPLLLALLVQGRAWVQPLVAVARLAASPAVQACRWIAAGIALAGPADALSAASASIDGLVLYNGTVVVEGPTNRVGGKVGTPFKARITVLNPGSDHNADLFDCRPVPPGLTIDTNAGSKGYILGTPTKAGSYAVTLYAGNTNYTGGMVTMDATIDVAPNGTPPVITRDPAPLSVTAGQPAAFAVQASGDPAPKFQWRRNGRDIPGATAATFAIPSASAADAGVYTVVATNDAGTVESNAATLSVAPAPVPPSIVVPPSDQLAAEGGTATFSVSASGDAPLAFQWRLGSGAVPGGNLATLTLTNLSAAMAGLYSVVVSNGAGSATSAPAALVVAPFAGVPLRIARATKSGDAFLLGIEGPRVGTYTLETSADTAAWTPVATLRVTTGSWEFATKCAAGAGFFRATAAP